MNKSTKMCLAWKWYRHRNTENLSFQVVVSGNAGLKVLEGLGGGFCLVVGQFCHKKNGMHSAHLVDT